MTRERKRKPRRRSGSQRRESVPQRRRQNSTLSLKSSTMASADTDTLLSRARTHWLFGEWLQLCELDAERIAMQEERAAIALLVSSAQQQQGDHKATRHWARQAIHWGMAPNAVARLLAAGVHNTLGRMALLREDKDGIGRHFAASMKLAALNDTDTGTLVRARASQEAKALNQSLPNLGLLQTHDAQRETSWDITRAPTREDVINGYGWILGRQPESDKAILAHENESTVASLRKSLINSDEFFFNASKKVWEEAAPHAEERSVRRIVLMHLPKTGGTTLHTMLKEKFSDDQICPDRWNNLFRLSLEDASRYRLFSGHFDYYSCRMIPGDDKKIVSMLRDPKARLVSLYYFERAHRREVIDDERLDLARLANELNILDFFSHEKIKEHNSIKNAMVNALSGCVQRGRWERYEPPGMQACKAVFSSESERLQLAKDNLQSLDAFGILEEFEKSVWHIFTELGLEPPEAHHRENALDDVVTTNPGLKPVDKASISEELDQLLDDLTDLDRELYDFAYKLFSQRTCKE